MCWGDYPVRFFVSHDPSHSGAAPWPQADQHVWFSGGFRPPISKFSDCKLASSGCFGLHGSDVWQVDLVGYSSRVFYSNNSYFSVYILERCDYVVMNKQGMHHPLLSFTPSLTPKVLKPACGKNTVLVTVANFSLYKIYNGNKYFN